MKKPIAALLVCLSAASAIAEDAKAKAAREELERQLHQMVGKQPTKVRIDFIGLEDPNYQIEEASFDLDGRSLRTPPLGQLSDDGAHLIWNGDVTPGKHTVKVLLVFSNGASVVLSDEGGYKWKIGGDVTFEVNSGIEVRIQVKPTRDPGQRDVAKRFKLSLPAQPVMIAALDDGVMPEAPAKPTIVAQVDAGRSSHDAQQLAEEKKKRAELAAQEKAQKTAAAAEAKRLAAEAKKQKLAEALEAKRAAAAEKKERAAAALEARRAAAAEKKEQAAAALEARRAAREEKKLAALAAAEEKKRLAQAALDAKNAPAVPVAAAEPADAGVAVATAEPVDAGLDVIDAGAIAEATPVDAGASAPVVAAPPVEEDGLPWLLIAGVGAAISFIFLVVVARRRARPPTLDD